MRVTRREFLRLAALTAATAAVQACSPVYRQLAGDPILPAGWHSISGNWTFSVLNRLTFGARLEERQLAEQIGLAGWIEEQLSPNALDDSATDWRVRAFDSLHMTADELDGWEKRDVIAELKQATILRQVYSKRQLYEIMVEFWSDHFNIAITKGLVWMLKTVDDREVIRANALGNFGDLLRASAHSPAMLIYLDNQANHKDHPNENYARELMELHSLGVDGGYTQEDVMELARCLTGWSVKKHFWPGEFTFNTDVHDMNEKVFLGRDIRPEGIGEGEFALEILAAHPSTAQHIAQKLVRRFVSDQPMEEAGWLVERAANAFQSTNGDIQAVLRVVLLDGLAAMPEIPSPKFKRPLHYVASALRLMNAESDGSLALHEALSLMGQPSFQWPTPDGPPDTSSAWLGNLLPRWQFSLELTQNQLAKTYIDWENLLAISGAQDPAELADLLGVLLLGSPLPETGRDDLLRDFESSGVKEMNEIAPILAAGLLASPNFQYR